MKEVIDNSGNKILVESSTVVKTVNGIHYLLNEDEMNKFNEDNVIYESERALTKSKELALIREKMYEKEGDPLFFQWQRGEIDKQAWLDKIDEIRRKYS